jgi:hypothetical protein
MYVCLLFWWTVEPPVGVCLVNKYQSPHSMFKVKKAWNGAMIMPCTLAPYVLSLHVLDCTSPICLLPGIFRQPRKASSDGVPMSSGTHALTGLLKCS